MEPLKRRQSGEADVPRTQGRLGGSGFRAGDGSCARQFGVHHLCFLVSGSVGAGVLTTSCVCAIRQVTSPRSVV